MSWPLQDQRIDLSFSFLNSCVILSAVTGTEASVAMCTNSLDHRGLNQHMILLMNILTMMPTRLVILDFIF